MRLNEYDVHRSPAKFREWAYEDVSGEMVMLFDELNVPGPDRNKYYDYMESADGRAYLKKLYDMWTDEETAAKQFIDFCKEQFKQVKEDFSMGVEGPLGLNQGIPHGGPGKGVLPKPLYDPKAKAVPPSKKDDEDTEKNKKEMEKSLNKKQVSEAQLSKNLQLYIKKTDGSTSRLQFISRAEAKSKSHLIDIANRYTSDWIELWTVGYELDDEGYATKELKDMYITNPKLVSEKKIQESEENPDAMTLLKWLHYQICNGGLEQAAENGYIDRLFNYGEDKFIDDVKQAVDVSTDAGAACLKAALMIANAADQLQLTKICPDCYGYGEYETEDDFGEPTTERCSLCNGDGTLGVSDYSDIDFGSGSGNEWTDSWDSKYYKEIDSNLVDDATGQSHTHSVVLDAIRDNQKNESVVDPFEDFLQRVDRFLYKAGYESDEIEEFIAIHEKELKERFEKGMSADDAARDLA